LNGKSGAADVPGWDDRERQWLFYSPIPATGWTFLALTPERLALAEVHTRMITAAAALTATLVIIVLCIALVTRRTTMPLSRLTAKVGEISAGNIDARVEGVTSNDELGQLAAAFNTMAGRLREHINITTL